MTSQGGAPSWSHPEQYSALTPMESQDFQSLVDLDAVNFDFDFLNDFDPTNSGDTNGKLPGSIDPNLFATSAQQGHAIQATHLSSAPHTMAQGSPMFDMGMHMNFDAVHSQPFNMQPGHNPMGHHQTVPPTPNSVEMHADAARYLQQMDAQSHAMMEHYQMSKPDAVSMARNYYQFNNSYRQMNNFTPLGTPAVTPHEGAFNIHNEYTVPGAYFSPLTSPALEGQQQNGQHTSASSVATTSPIDHDVDMLGESAVPAEPVARKTRKRINVPRTNGGSRKVAQSPIQKPMQRKKTAISAIQSREMNELLEATSKSRLSPTSPRNARMPHNYTSSESISPEPLSEVMGPPPKPGSAKPSPAILGKSPNFTAKGPGHSPATPASLMRLQPSGDVNGAITVPSPIHEIESDMPMLEDLALPEAVISTAKRPGVSRIDTANANGDATPRLGARKGKKSGMTTPIVPSSGPSTAKPTPIGSTVTSPMNGLASPVMSKQNAKNRMSKKRGSVSGNVPLSPAMRPKISISPNIQPLLPGGGPGNLNDQERTSFLASRSNYQNLIEGTNIPGVSYPSDLPTQLTSKRTSHKIAEQGRRQRINIALQEMQTLLPKSLPGEKNGVNDDEDDDDEDDDGGKRKGSGSGGGGKGGGNSKAATVESAIVYIKTLQLQKKDWGETAEVRERKWREEQEIDRKENDELKGKIKELEEKLAVALKGEKTSAATDKKD
jgi:hypothetical protein